MAAMTIPKEKNLLNREIIALYRHHYYSLEKEQWSEYAKSIQCQLKERANW